MKLYLLLLFVALLGAYPALAQEEDAGGIYGYTSIDYDAESNTVTAYSETDLDPSLLAYYAASVELSMYTEWPLTNSWNGDASAYSETITFQGVPSTSYTAYGIHSAALLVQDNAPCDVVDDPNCIYGGNVMYWDVLGFGNLSGLDLSDWGGAEYFSPGGGGDIPDPSAQVGTTYDSASLTVPGHCGDIRDSIIGEYISKHSPYQSSLTCANFITSSTWDQSYAGLYTFANLTPDEASLYRDNGWAVLQPELAWGLTNMSNVVGQTFSISSGYRNPQAEIDAAVQNHVQPHMNSRHLAGDAVDIRTKSDAGLWQQVHNAGIQNDGCVEPWLQSSYSHVHVDWRTEITVAPFGNVKCAPVGDSNHVRREQGDLTESWESS